MWARVPTWDEAVPKRLLVAVFCFASLNGSSPCSTFGTTTGPTLRKPCSTLAPPLVGPVAEISTSRKHGDSGVISTSTSTPVATSTVLVATTTSTPVPGPCATNMPGRAALDIGIGLGGAAVAGVVSGLVVVLHGEMTTPGYPTQQPRNPTQMNASRNVHIQVNMNPTQMSKMVFNMSETINADAKKLAGGLSIFMILGGIALFCLLSVLIRAGFKRTRDKIKEQETDEVKKMKKFQKEAHKDQKKTRDGMQLVASSTSSRTLEANEAPLIQKEKQEKKHKEHHKKKKAKSDGGSDSNHGSSSSSSSSDSSDSEHSDRHQSGCCV